MAKNYTKQEVLDAIEGSVGIILTVSKRLQCTWDTAKRWIERWEETRRAFSSETEKILDLAEGQVFKAVQNGDIATAKWVLARKGRHRGYDETAMLKVDDSNPLNINFSGISAEEILAADNVEINRGDDESSTE